MLAGIDAAVDPFPGFKIDSVIIRGVNDDEIIPLLEFAKARGAEIRFIEYMDVGGATTWSMSQVVSRKEMLETIAAHYGPVEPLREVVVRAGRSLSPAGRHRVRDHRVDDRAVLPVVRSQPADRRRRLVPVPVCGARRRPCVGRCAAA